MNFEEVKLFQGDELLAQALIFRNDVCRNILSVAQGHGHKFAVRHHRGHDLDHWFGCAPSILVHSDKFAWSKLLPDKSIHFREGHRQGREAALIKSLQQLRFLHPCAEVIDHRK